MKCGVTGRFGEEFLCVRIEVLTLIQTSLVLALANQVPQPAITSPIIRKMIVTTTNHLAAE